MSKNYLPKGLWQIILIAILASPSLADSNVTSFDPYQYWDYAHGGQNYNATYDATRLLCIYPISGQYTLLNRVLYYALIIFSILAAHHSWLVAGPLAYIITYSSTSAVHALILSVVSKNGLLDLDVLGAWAIISVACLIILPLFTMGDKIRESKYSPVFGLWGTLVCVGGICSIVSIHREYPDEPMCRSTSGDLLTTQIGLLKGNFGCSYTCFDTSQALRGSSEILAIPKSLAFGHFRILEATVYLTAIFGLLSGITACLPAHRKRTDAELKDAIRINAPRRGDYPKRARNKAHARKRAQKELDAGDYVPSGMTVCWTIMACPSVIIVMILNEIFILGYQGGFPIGEMPYAIGQWGAWVGVLLAIVAAWLVKWHMPEWEKRQKTLKGDKENFKKRKEAAERGKAGWRSSSESMKLELKGIGEPFIDLEAGLGGYFAKKKEVISKKEVKLSPGQKKGLSGIYNLGSAAADGYDERVRELLDGGVDVNAEQDKGLTALVRAAWGGHESTVRLLIERGADVKGEQGDTAIKRAQGNGYSGVVRVLREARGG